MSGAFTLEYGSSKLVKKGYCVWIEFLFEETGRLNGKTCLWKEVELENY